MAAWHDPTASSGGQYTQWKNPTERAKEAASVSQPQQQSQLIIITPVNPETHQTTGSSKVFVQEQQSGLYKPVKPEVEAAVSKLQEQMPQGAADIKYVLQGNQLAASAKIPQDVSAIPLQKGEVIVSAGIAQKMNWITGEQYKESPSAYYIVSTVPSKSSQQDISQGLVQTGNVPSEILTKFEDMTRQYRAKELIDVTGIKTQTTILKDLSFSLVGGLPKSPIYISAEQEARQIEFGTSFVYPIESALLSLVGLNPELIGTFVKGIPTQKDFANIPVDVSKTQTIPVSVPSAKFDVEAKNIMRAEEQQYIADIQAEKPYAVGSLLGNIAGIATVIGVGHVLGERYSGKITEETLKRENIEPIRNYETGEIEGVKIGTALEMERVKFTTGEIFSPTGERITQEITLIKAVGTPMVEKNAQFFVRQTAGADIGKIFTTESRFIPYQDFRLTRETFVFDTSGTKGIYTQTTKTGMGESFATMLEMRQVKTLFTFEQTPPPSEVLQRIGFRTMDVTRGTTEDFLTRVGAEPSIKEISEARAGFLIGEIKSEAGETLGFYVRGGTEQLDIFRKGFTLSDEKFQELLHNYQENMLREDIGYDIRTIRKGQQVIILDREALTKGQLDILKGFSAYYPEETLTIRSAETFRYTSPEKSFESRLTKVSPLSQQELDNLDIQRSIENFNKFRESGGINAVRNMETELIQERASRQNLELKTLKTGTPASEVIAQLESIAAVPKEASFVSLIPIISTKPSEKISEKPLIKIETETFVNIKPISKLNYNYETETNLNTKIAPETILQPETRNILETNLQPALEIQPKMELGTKMQLETRLQERVQLRTGLETTTYPIPIEKEKFNLGFKRKQPLLSLGKLNLSKLSFKGMTTSTLFNIEQTFKKFGKVSFGAGAKTEKAFAQEVGQYGVFANFPTAEQIKAKKGRFEI